jgi:hypothetical protein
MDQVGWEDDICGEFAGDVIFYSCVGMQLNLKPWKER